MMLLQRDAANRLSRDVQQPACSDTEDSVWAQQARGPLYQQNWDDEIS